jgi:type IV pilus assembly protein PilB
VNRFKDEWLVAAAETVVGAAAVAALRREGAESLADALVDSGKATGEELGRAVTALHKTVGYVEPEVDGVEKMALSLVPERVCRRTRALPLKVVGETLQVAMANPLDLDALSDLEAISGRVLTTFWCLPRRVDALIDELYNPDAVIFDLLDRVGEGQEVEILEGPRPDEDPASLTVAERAPVMRLVNAILSKAVSMHASDIHIEHEERSSLVRFRVDGDLRSIMTLPRHLGVGALVSRIKIMADLDIADRRKPQDGRAKIRIGGIEMGLRVSTLPAQFGEKVVIRILDPRSAQVSFEALGLSEEVTRRFNAVMSESQGMVLLTGPTGSGKTTTLYSALNRIKSTATNVITVEDPIEYKLDGINQVQVQEKQGLSFAAVLRSVLRQDPDVIMIGEIRDHETADIAFQAALTGHFVLSTLHTNDTVSTIGRLADMGIEPFKLGPALLAITAQRLVRRLCPKCREEVPAAEADAAILSALRAAGLPAAYYRPKGCEDCAGLGVKGRCLLIEFLDVSKPVKEAIARGDGEQALREAALACGALRPLSIDALTRLSQGEAALDEVYSHLRLEDVRARATAPATARPAPAPPSARPASKPGRRVLICDDDASIRVLLRAVLEKAGYAVSEAVDGRDGLVQAAAGAPDVMIVDLHMPHLDGHGVIRGVRGGLGGAFPIIMLTSDDEEKSQEEALNLGADDYVMKPFKPALVVARVAAALRRFEA